MGEYLHKSNKKILIFLLFCRQLPEKASAERNGKQGKMTGHSSYVPEFNGLYGHFQ
jgi:hypothetical protein